MAAKQAAIRELRVSTFTIPTDAPEADGTFSWNKTTMVLVELSAAAEWGLGYTYAASAAADLIGSTLKQLVIGEDALDIPAVHARLGRAVRNIGRSGIASCAIAAIDAALWDLKAKLFKVPLCKLLGMARESVPIYGSGGFTSYSIQRLQKQLGGWAAEGISMVKMKIGTHPEDDFARAKAAREAIGPDVQLFVDANGAYSRKQALKFAEEFAALGVTWFEEPVSSDDVAGLRLIRDRAPAGMEIAAGEYGFTPDDFRRLLESGAVDVLQADATRCAGITGILSAATIAESFHTPFSAHTSPSLHLHACCAAPGDVRHIEYFHDHSRIEQMLFDGAAVPVNGHLVPDLSRPGLGLSLKRADAEKFAA